MPIPDRAHLQNLTFDELDPIFLAENSDLNHSVIFVNAEGSSKGFDLHGVATKHTPSSTGLTTITLGVSGASSPRVRTSGPAAEMLLPLPADIRVLSQISVFRHRLLRFLSSAF